MFRQGTNWASRQGFTDYFRNLMKDYKFKDSNVTTAADVKLSVAEESLAAICGGALSTWNQPFEVRLYFDLVSKLFFIILRLLPFFSGTNVLIAMQCIHLFPQMKL
jgi:hypothetical protein